MSRILTLLYGVVAYVIGAGSLVYAIGFIADLVVPKSVDAGGALLPWQEAMLIDLALLAVFGVQHSVMARRGFKRWWTRIVPEAVERSTFVLVSGLLLSAIFLFWAPIPTIVWSVEAPAARTAIMAVYFIGWGVLFLSSFLINHFNLFGLQQVYAAWRGREAVTDPSFRTPLLYKLVRHPLLMGFIMTFWAAPDMTVGRLVFALGSTAYILIGIAFEERDLVATHGDAYRNYRKRVRMLLPLPVARAETMSTTPLGRSHGA